MPENPAQMLSADRDEQAHNSHEVAQQTIDMAAVQQQVQAGEVDGFRQQNRHTGRHFWQVPAASEAVNPEPKNERSQERQRQQERDGWGFSL